MGKKLTIFYVDKNGNVQKRKINAENAPLYAKKTISKEAANRLTKRRETRRSPARPRPPAGKGAARAAPEAPPSGPPVDVVPTVERATGRRGATYFTLFKAMGSSGTLESLARTPGGKSPNILSDDLTDEAAPAAFFSNQGLLLGKVRWNGILSLDTVIGRLNDRLQYLGEERDAFDFRDVYTNWSYRYSVVEKIGPSTRTIDFADDSSARRRRG